MPTRGQKYCLSAIYTLGLVCLLGLPLLADEVSIADAAQQGRFSLAMELLTQGASVNAPQADGMTALHWAVRYSNEEAALALIRAGANTSATNRYGVSPLSLACTNGDDKIVDMLLSTGADAKASLPGGETLLMTASRTGRVGPVKSLLARGVDVNAREHKGQTALMWAAAEGHTEVVNALLEAGADPTIQLRSGFNALFFAVRQGKIETVLRLLKAGADVNSEIATQQGIKFVSGRLTMTPLLMAIENGHFELASLMLDAGANPNAAPSGYGALHALSWVRKPIRGDGDPPPDGSGRLTSLDIARKLVVSGANIRARLQNGKSELGRFTYSGSTPFLLAAQTADVQFMDLLYQLGADINEANDDGCTPLLAATGVGALGDGDESAGTEDETIAAVEFLLQHGANINCVDHNGETVMHGAAYQSLAKLVGYLVRSGADPKIWNHENRAGWTPRLIALGYRPGNFRPDPQTLAAIESIMQVAGEELADVSHLTTPKRSWSSTRNSSSKWVVKDLAYATAGSQSLLLDLHFPLHVTGSPLIVWVHGGAWRSGSKDNMPLDHLVGAGYTVASINYRLSTEAAFPAQIHDIKAAIRFLRGIATRYGYRSDRIAVAGSSAGGHLAALVGTTNGVETLEGDIGEYRVQSSDVHAIVDFFGPTNLMTILPQSTPHGLSVRVPALQLLLGAQPEEVPELARLASPVEHVDSQDPPLLLIHGDQDPQVPINQSIEILGKYEALGLPVQFEMVHDAAHGGAQFFDEERQLKVKSFLDAVFSK
ncbi:MAG: ankyrin repeat domain-containing protein [Planctomycetales bacterium]|nr:ankyrin repeat domain-containing protein [Planctomycetales bacterium]